MPDTPEQQARRLIDAQLETTGWQVQDCAEMNLYAGQGVAVREFPLTTGYADYLLLADGKAIGVVEAKEMGTTPLSPLPEQHRIVAEIEKHLTRLDAGVAALKRAQAKLRRYRAAVLKAACEGQLAPSTF